MSTKRELYKRVISGIAVLPFLAGAAFAQPNLPVSAAGHQTSQASSTIHNEAATKRPMQLSEQQMDNVTAGVARPGFSYTDFPDLPKTRDQGSDDWNKATEKFRTADGPKGDLPDSIPKDSPFRIDPSWVPEGVPGPEKSKYDNPPSPPKVPTLPHPAPMLPPPPPTTSPSQPTTHPAQLTMGTAPVVSDLPGAVLRFNR